MVAKERAHTRLAKIICRWVVFVWPQGSRELRVRADAATPSDDRDFTEILPAAAGGALMLPRLCAGLPRNCSRPWLQERRLLPGNGSHKQS